MHNEHEQTQTHRTFKDFLPLITIICIILVLTCVSSLYMGFTAHNIMTNFMGFFFLIFGLFKLIHWSGFVKAYQMYDIIAKHSTPYAYAYPLIEIGLGVAYLLQWNLAYINILTLVLMIINSIGVTKELLAGRTITCACLGTVFKIPMTWVTLAEDLLMAGMASVMIFKS